MDEKHILFILSFLLFSVSCKKDKDTVTLHNINGMVFNNCIDGGLANVTVFLTLTMVKVQVAAKQ